MASTEKSIFCYLHGNNVEHSSNYPVINADFKITFTRTPGSSTVSWQVSNNTWSGTNYGTGTYGFAFASAITLSASSATPPTPSSSSEYIIEKTTTTMTHNWWNQVSLYNPSGSFTCTDSSAKLHVWVKSPCYKNNDPSDHCYDSTTGWNLITSISVTLPDYGYTVNYDTAGGSPSIPSQIKQVGVPLTLSTSVPSSQFQVLYYNDTDHPDAVTDAVTVSKTFTSWKCSADNNNYNSGGTYTLDQGCTMTAQWSNTFTPIAIPNKTYTVSFETNGGVAIPQQYADRYEYGYGESQSATVVVCQPGIPYSSETIPASGEISLWPIYGDATLLYTSLPLAIRDGYSFSGWYTDSALTNKVTGNITLTGNIILYAKWSFTTMYKYNDGWVSTNDYAWRYVDDAWHKIAHIYKYNASQSKWIDLIPAPQPADVFNHGNVVGLNPYYAEGISQESSGGSAYFWTYDNSVITKPYGYVTTMILGGLCDRGNFTKLCFECSGSGNSGRYNYFYVGIRFMRRGSLTHYEEYPNIYYKVTDYRIGTYSCPKQVIKLDITKHNDGTHFIPEPFYISISGCDCESYIHSMWFE